MSGHSKWATTKRQKAVVDAKRSSLFTKLAKNITIAARDGADPKMNFKLRIAIDKAKEASMPKDNIERAIARGAGGGDGAALERVVYEGYGPEGIAVIVEAITDNKNRAFSDIKHFFSKNGSNLGSSGAVGWMFDIRGIIQLADTQMPETTELALIDTGLIDTTNDGESISLITRLESLQNVKEAAETMGLTVTDSAVGYIPKEKVTPKDPDTIIRFLDGLDDLDDVDTVYTNADV